MDLRTELFAVDRSHPYADGLLAFYAGNSPRGGMALDSGANGLHATLTGFSGEGDTPDEQWHVGDAIGRATLRYDGGTDYLAVPNAVSLNIAGKISVLAWIRPTKIAAESVVVGKAYAVPITPWWLSCLTDTSLRFGHYHGGHVGVDGTVSASLLNGWHALCGGYDGAKYFVWCDGALLNTNTTASAPTANANAITIGRIGEVTPKYFTGAIADVAIYNRAVSASQIKSWADRGNVWLDGLLYPVAAGNVYPAFTVGRRAGLDGGLASLNGGLG